MMDPGSTVRLLCIHAVRKTKPMKWFAMFMIIAFSVFVGFGGGVFYGNLKSERQKGLELFELNGYTLACLTQAYHLLEEDNIEAKTWIIQAIQGPFVFLAESRMEGCKYYSANSRVMDKALWVALVIIDEYLEGHPNPLDVEVFDEHNLRFEVSLKYLRTELAPRN